MSEQQKAQRFEPDGLPVGSRAAALRSALQSAETPLTLGELSMRLGRPFHAVAVDLLAGSRAGDVERIDGGWYALRLQPALTELFALVLACEASWNSAVSSIWEP
jgi:hypothetical protein